MAKKKERWDDDFVGDWHRFFTGGITLTIWIVVVLAVLTFGTLAITRWAAPEAEAIRRDTHEESKSYIDGTIRDLDNLYVQWLAIPEGDGTRDALATMALHRAADFPEDRLPDRLADWLDELRKGER
jgi:hypothetical protein